MIYAKVCFEVIINYFSTMVFVHRNPKEQLVEREMPDTPKHCIQKLLGRSDCVLPGIACIDRNN